MKPLRTIPLCSLCLALACAGGGARPPEGLSTTHAFLVGTWTGTMFAGNSVFDERLVTLTMRESPSTDRLAATFAWSSPSCSGTIEGTVYLDGSFLRFDSERLACRMPLGSETRLGGTYSNPGAAASACLYEVGTFQLEKQPNSAALISVTEIYSAPDWIIVVEQHR